MLLDSSITAVTVLRTIENRHKTQFKISKYKIKKATFRNHPAKRLFADAKHICLPIRDGNDLFFCLFENTLNEN